MRGLVFSLFALGGALALACGPSEPQPVMAAAGPSASTSAAPPADGAAKSTKTQPCIPDDSYKPATVSSAPAPDLPDVPTLPQLPTKVGDAWTVFGATHALRSRISSKDVTRADITIIGVIIDENLKAAPACALHKTGKADPEGCVSPIPSFTLADAKDATTGITVLGWARNFAVVFDANKAYANGKPASPVQDEMYMVDVPYPLPAVGAKVKVTGKFGFSYTRSSTGLVTDPQNGVLTYARMETLEPAPKPAKLGP